MTTESEFFKEKRPWSRIKDEVLENYLAPYLKKVARLEQKIILVDAFAGQGVFDDESKGSPLILCENAERLVPDQYIAIFVNSDQRCHEILQSALSRLIQKNKVICIHGAAIDLLQELRNVLTTQTLFIYLDPFGLKGCEFDSIKPYLEREKLYSTEIVVNMSMPTLHRLATYNAVLEGKETDQTISLNQQLTRVLGGDWWKDIMWDGSLNPEEKEVNVVKKYQDLLKRYLPFTGSCPVREKTGKRTKYYIIFCSRHEAAMLLMNDIMHKAYFKKIHEADFRGTLFETVDWRLTKRKDDIKKIIVDEIKQTSGVIRKQLWIRIIQKHFMRWLESDYKKATQLLNDREIFSPTKRQTSRLNDNCELYLVKKNNPSSSTIEIKSIVSPKIKWHKYKLLAGKNVRLVDRVNDGSIIKRFDKTPIPEKPTDVICPHFLELKWAYGCPFDCSWCYLKGTFRFRPEGIKPAYKPLEKIKSHVEAFLSQVDTPEILNTGEIADSLMKEGKTSPFSRFIISMFQKQKTHKVLFLTKSTNIRNLLQMPEKSQVIMSFSLNAKSAAEKWEKKAPPVSKRIDAARKLVEAGYEVRIRIDPIVPIHNWQKHYKQLVDKMFSKFKPERITLGTLRGLQSTINGTKDHSWVHFLKEKSNWGKKIDFTTRYDLYKTILEYLKEEYDYTEVALCKETMAMWNKLGMKWQKIKCNCIW